MLTFIPGGVGSTEGSTPSWLQDLGDLLQCEEAGWGGTVLYLVDGDLLQLLTEGLAVQDHGHPLPLLHLLHILLHLSWPDHRLDVLGVIGI